MVFILFFFLHLLAEFWFFSRLFGWLQNIWNTFFTRPFLFFFLPLCRWKFSNHSFYIQGVAFIFHWGAYPPVWPWKGSVIDPPFSFYNFYSWSRRFFLPRTNLIPDTCPVQSLSFFRSERSIEKRNYNKNTEIVWSETQPT